jgi:hypothetical protein
MEQSLHWNWFEAKKIDHCTENYVCFVLKLGFLSKFFVYEICILFCWYHKFEVRSYCSKKHCNSGQQLFYVIVVKYQQGLQVMCLHL